MAWLPRCCVGRGPPQAREGRRTHAGHRWLPGPRAARAAAPDVALRRLVFQPPPPRPHIQGVSTS
eukprot:11163516-Lingulodinium_polyedra.AAC.1